MSAPCVIDMCFALPHLHTTADLARVVTEVLDSARYMDECARYVDEARHRVHVVVECYMFTHTQSRGE